MLLVVSQWRFLLELVDLLQKELASYTSLFSVVTQVAKAILDLGGVFDDNRSIVHLSLQDLREHLVDVVGVSTFDSDAQGHFILLDLEVEGNLLDNLLLIDDQVVTQFKLARVLGQLGKFCEVYTKLDLVKDVVANGLLTL